jgi:DNA-binding NarL/FixJ family response regulator
MMQKRKTNSMADQLVCPVKPKDMPTSARANAGRLTSVGVVEDDADLRRSLIRLIDHATGMRCVGSWPEGASALAEISALKPDVVLMDINMPGMSGIECTARLKQVCPDTQVIMVTVYADSENIFSALQAGACGYLLKRTPSSGII